MRFLGALVLMTGSVVAQEYPIQGLLGATQLFEEPLPATADHAMPTDGLARCAISIVDQKADGSFTTYIADLDAFAAGKVAYVPIVAGKCVIAADGVETCKTERQAAGLEDALEFYDVPANAGPEGLDVATYDTKEDAAARVNSPGYFKFFQCPVQIEKVTAAFGTEFSPLTQDEINGLRYPSDDLLADPRTLAIVEAIRK